MSSYSRGKAFEKFVADHLRQAGYEIFFKSQFIRFGSIDFAGLWDLVGAKKLSPAGASWIFVQCKSRKLYGKEMAPLLLWKAEYALSGMECKLAVKTKEKRRTAIKWIPLANP